LSVTFLIRRDDVVRFLETAEKDKAPEGKEWIVFLTVTDNKLSFRGGDTDYECPIHNATVGKVRVPISSLAAAAGWGWYRPKSKKDEMGKTDWAEMTFVDGRVTYGTGVSNSEGISIACTVENFDFYPKQAQIIALSRLLDPETMSRIGLKTRLPHVLANLDRGPSDALRPLQRYGVTEDDIKDVVERALKRTETEVASLGFYRHVAGKTNES
jgi:hypothetical protein